MNWNTLAYRGILSHCKFKMPFFCCDLLLRENLMLNKNCQRNSLGKTGPTARKEGGKDKWFWNRVISPFQISDIRANKEKYQCYHSLHTFIIIKIKGQIKWCFKVKALKFHKFGNTFLALLQAAVWDLITSRN